MTTKEFMRVCAMGSMCLLGRPATAQDAQTAAPPRPAAVTIVQADGKFTLTVEGKLFFINGAGGTRYMDKLVQAGGNSVRTWSSSRRDLDAAQRYGLMVCMGLRMRPVRHEADYTDETFLKRQRDQVLSEVEKLKDHPALLMWAIGNEIEHEAGRDASLLVWKEVEEIAKAIKQIDANHPVITVLAGTGRKLEDIKQLCPSLDAVGINSYGQMRRVPADLKKYGWQKPYLITEFGPRGWWETDKTSWGLPIEDTSTEKAAFYADAYNGGVAGQPNCLGSYVFLWGNKQEKTHTWFCLFLPDGRATEIVDTMTKLWTGNWPANRAPMIDAKEIYAADGSTAYIYPAGSTQRFCIDAQDREGKAIKVEWDLRKDESDNPATGGDYERPIAPIEAAVIEAQDNAVIIRMPQEAGNCRLFAYVSDDSGKVATANLPIKVENAVAP
ncbi:MAG: hypothetical protein LLF76_15480 [Planctomycetaceae bacterium]|nr:hypothetical protein [Planctomycetaceae bacterium]